MQIKENDTELEDVIARYRKDKINIKLAEEFIKERMGDLEELIAGCHRVEWKTCKGATKTDWRAIATKLDAPARMIGEHTSTGAPVRRFKIS